MPESKPQYKQIKKDFSAFRSAVKKLGELFRASEEIEKKVLLAAEEKIKSDSARALNEMPVEELNSAEKGINVSALKSAGINTVGQVMRLSQSQLDGIQGIGEKTVQKIIGARTKIAQSIFSNTALRVSADDKSKEADAFVEAMYQYIGCNECVEKAAQLFPDSEALDGMVKSAKPATGGIRWSFSSQQKKEAALQSVSQIQELLNSSFVSKVDELTQAKLHIMQAKHDEYWKHFSNNAATYYSYYESIKAHKKDKKAKALKKAEAVAVANGFPEEFAIAVSEVELNLTGFKIPLRAYQEYGVKYILRQGAVLIGDDMGLGKTAEAIAAMVCLRNAGQEHFMVVCPASVLSNWIREIEKFSDLPTYKVHGDTISNYGEWLVGYGVCVTTYETLQKLSVPQDYKLSMLVVDEAHYVKNPNANRTKALIAFRAITDRVVFLSGTPLENNVGEMCFLIGCLQPDVANAVKGSTNTVMAADFRRKIAPVYFRRKKEDVLDELPEKTEQEIYCHLNSSESAVYRQSVVNGDFMGMRQVSWNVENAENSSKGEQLREICCQAVQNGNKVIVFSFFRNTIQQVMKLLDEGVCYGPISGDVSPQKRQEIVDEFTNRDGGAVLVSQIMAGGTGMNIQAANVVIICEPQLKPSIENQAIARAYRMGQSKHVFVYRLLSDNTVDEKIMLILKSKQKLFDEFADKSESGEQSLEALGDSDITSIIKSEQKRLCE